MSALAFLIAAVIAFVATLIYAGITGTWSARELAAMFCFALSIIILPAFIHA